MPTYSPPTQPTSLWNWLLKFNPDQYALAWCHTTDAFQLRSIIKEGSLCPQHCRVFDEALLYFFYGRPAFRRNSDNQIRLTSKAPIVIILRPEVATTSGCRIFPFDSGAFEDRYSQWLHGQMQLCDFELGCHSSAPQRVVKAFFGSNERYLNVQPTYPELKYDGIFEVESVFEILSDPSAENADDRRLAVELQVKKQIPFNSSSIMALIVPDELSQADWFNEFQTNSGNNIEIIRYELQLLKRADHYQALLETLAIQFHKSARDPQINATI